MCYLLFTDNEVQSPTRHPGQISGVFNCFMSSVDALLQHERPSKLVMEDDEAKARKKART
jgi:hypothetical protein